MPGRLPRRHRDRECNARGYRPPQVSLEHRITLPVAAARLRVPYYQAYRLALRGALGPVEQIAGRHWVLDAEAVQRYIDAKTKQGAPAAAGQG